MDTRTIRSSLIILFIIVSCSGPHSNRDSIREISLAGPDTSLKSSTLPVPPLLRDLSQDKKRAQYELVVQRGSTEFFSGTSAATYGYNGNILGPTLRAKRGQEVIIRVRNRLREYTTVHWHGMLVPGNMDGGPHQVIPPDGEWRVRFRVSQPAATLWYHPHGLGTTAVQVYRGLAGLFIIDDSISDRLPIPSEYGKNDIPLIIQDRRFSSDGVPLYLTGMRDIMEGMKGETILVNGVIKPFLRVSATRYRFRILNGSNARVFDFKLSTGGTFYQIAADSGFLHRPHLTRSIRLSPGERAEILVDFSSFKEGDTLRLVSDYFTILEMRVGAKSSDPTSIPATLAPRASLPLSAVRRTRVFHLEGMGHMVSINRKQMDINRIDEYVKKGDTEIWTITSSTRGMMGMGMMRGTGGIVHNFHAHGIHFLILDRNGTPAGPGEQGWKDTVLLDEGERVRVITRFLYRGIFMYHCHILEHEDNGMMGQFKVD